MEPIHPKRFPSARHVLRAISAALIVYFGASIVDQTVGAEPGVEPRHETTAATAALLQPSHRLLPHTTDAR